MSDTVRLAVKVTYGLFETDECFLGSVSFICILFCSFPLITWLEKCHSGMNNVLYLIVL